MGVHKICVGINDLCTTLSFGLSGLLWRRLPRNEGFSIGLRTRISTEVGFLCLEQAQLALSKVRGRQVEDKHDEVI